MRLDMHVDMGWTCEETCVLACFAEMCVDTRVDMRVDMCVDTCADMRADMCVGVRADMRSDMCPAFIPVMPPSHR